MSNGPNEYSLGRIDEILENESVWEEPPGELEPALLSAISGAERVELVSPSQSSSRRWWGYAAAALVATVVAFIAFGPFGGDDQPPATIIALTGAGVDGEAAVGAADAGWWIQVNVEGLDGAPEGSFYEGWVSDGENMISVGTFHMRDGSYVTLWSGVPLRDYPELLVTLQDEGAGPAPSGEVVLSGRLEG